MTPADWAFLVVPGTAILIGVGALIYHKWESDRLDGEIGTSEHGVRHRPRD